MTVGKIWAGGSLLLGSTTQRLGKGSICLQMSFMWIFTLRILIDLQVIYYMQLEFSYEKNKKKNFDKCFHGLLSWKHVDKYRK